MATLLIRRASGERVGKKPPARVAGQRGVGDGDRRGQRQHRRVGRASGQRLLQPIPLTNRLLSRAWDELPPRRVINGKSGPLPVGSPRHSPAPARAEIGARPSGDLPVRRDHPPRRENGRHIRDGRGRLLGQQCVDAVGRPGPGDAEHVGRDLATVGPDVGASSPAIMMAETSANSRARAPWRRCRSRSPPRQPGPLLVQFATSPANDFGTFDVNPVDNLAYAGVPVLLAPSVASTTLMARPRHGGHPPPPVWCRKIAFAAPLAAKTATDPRTEAKDLPASDAGSPGLPRPPRRRPHRHPGGRAADPPVQFHARTKTVTPQPSPTHCREKGAGLAVVLSRPADRIADGTKLPAGAGVVTLTR